MQARLDTTTTGLEIHKFQHTDAVIAIIHESIGVRQKPAAVDHAAEVVMDGGRAMLGDFGLARDLAARGTTPASAAGEREKDVPSRDGPNELSVPWFNVATKRDSLEETLHHATPRQATHNVCPTTDAETN